jgi:hypothetical protein
MQGEEDSMTPQMHADAIKKRLAASDVQDKAEFRRRQKETKLALKIKLKKMLNKKDSDDEDNEGPVRLGDGGDDSSDASDREHEEQGMDGDSDDESTRGKGGKTKRAKDGIKRKRNNTLAAEGAGGYDLAAQEDMALALIMAKRRK